MAVSDPLSVLDRENSRPTATPKKHNPYSSMEILGSGTRTSVARCPENEDGPLSSPNRGRNSSSLLLVPALDRSGGTIGREESSRMLVVGEETRRSRIHPSDA